MEYILLDNFNGTLNIISKDDGSGEPLIFTSLLEAADALDEQCQNGVIIPLDTNIIKLLGECENFISTILDEEGKENFDIDYLTKQLDEVLDLKE
jgi:hypothetical protein